MSQQLLSGDRSARHAADAIVAAYRARTPKSSALFQRAARVQPGGTSGNLRFFQPYPLYFSGGSGSSMIDVDGHRYIDCFLCNGPLLLGHQHPAVMASLREHAATGSLVVNPPLGIELAEELQRMIPCAERVRFVNSGTEAVLSALRVARAATGRPRIVKFFGHYHGQDDQVMLGLETDATPLGAGIPAESLANTRLVRYGDIAALDKLLATDDAIAAVILDPAMHAGGLWGSSTTYLQAVRDLTTRRRVLLIFDEVITGFRLAAGGAQSHYGVTPDLATYAKALGAGERLGAIVGRASIMAGLDPNRAAGTPAVFQSGTGNDGTAGLAAGRAAVVSYQELGRSGAYGTLAGRAAHLADGLSSAFRNHGVSLHINQLGPMLQLFLTDREPSFERFGGLPTGPLELFYLALINEGVLLSLPTSNHIYLSFAHSDTDITRILEAARIVLDRFDFRELVAAALQTRRTQ